MTMTHTFNTLYLKVQNNTRFSVWVKTTNSVLKISTFYLNQGQKLSIRLEPGSRVSTIEVTYEDAGEASVTKKTNYRSPNITGDTKQDYIIEEIALDEQQTKFECRVVPRTL